MSNNAQNVTAGKPKIVGAVYRAPIGTTLPTTADGELDSAFKNLGYISDAGVVNSNAPTNTDIKAWGGDIVLSVLTDKPDTFKMAFIESKNLDVLKTIYGEANVSGDIDNGITVKANSGEQADQALVIDMVLKGAIKRIVIPDCKATALGDITYVDGSAVSYDTTFTCYPDSNGDTHLEYIKKSSSDPSF